MDKLPWVLLPLALAALVLALLAWRRGMPSRHGLNVGFSLLLLAYVLTTAGLGIFWVANQQLPVFDWHYLFGYATVSLLVVHLVFNLRIVWQYLRRKVGAAPPSAGLITGTGRRPLLGAAGVGGLALAAGLGYVLGLRHGRTELHLTETQPSAARGATRSDGVVATAPLPTQASARAWAVVEQFHAFSAHSRTGVLRHAASTDWGLAPPPFKRYPGAERLALPAPSASRTAAQGSAAMHAAAASADLAALGAWLWCSAGVSATRGGIHFRTSPSSGALFATELYVLPLGIHGLATGLWHYDPEGNALQHLPRRAGAVERAEGLAQLGPLALPQRCDALIIATAIFARSGHKYGDRTYRYVLADLGHALENLRTAALAHGQRDAHLLTHFDEHAIGSALGLDPKREAVLAVIALRASTAAPAAPATSGARWTSPDLQGPPGQAARLGLTEAMQWATSVRPATTSASAAHRAPADAGSSPLSSANTGPASPVEHRLPAARRLDADWLQIIAKRRSVRRFSKEPIAQQALSDILAAMTSPPTALSPAVRIDLLSAAVQGIEPAAWRHEPAGPLLRRRVVHASALRKRARAAALDQDVIGDAAVVFVLSLDRAVLQADPYGAARGYRHGFIEAGLVGERLYLAAGALGLAVCAVGAFYDDEASALVGVDSAREWVVHFAALGVPG